MIITNISHVLKEIKDTLLAEEYVTMNGAVYSPSLSYDNAMKSFKALKQADKETVSNPDVPLLAFNRSALRRDVDKGYKGSNTGYMAGSNPGVASPFATFSGEFDFRFRFFANKITDIEAFEMAYLANTLETVYTVTYPASELEGDWEYDVIWANELEDIEIEEENNYVHSIGGQAKVSGQFLVFDTGDIDSQKLIETINLEFEVYYNNYAEVLADKITEHNA